MTTYCPDCLEPVTAKASAREGRCEWCRPTRRHSEPRTPNAQERWRELLTEHGGSA